MRSNLSIAVVVILVFILGVSAVQRIAEYAGESKSNIPNPVTPVGSTSTEWELYSDSTFTAVFPSLPKKTTQTGDFATGRGYSKFTIYAAHSDTSMFVLEVGEFLQDETRDSTDVFQSSYDLISSGDGITVVYSSPMELKGNQAFRMDYVDEVNGQYTRALFLYWDGSQFGLHDRYYTLSKLSAGGENSEDDFDTFVRSFNINH